MSQEGIVNEPAKSNRDLRKTSFWYIIGCIVMFGLIVLGVTSEDPSSYYNNTDTTPWWSPINIIGACIFSLLIPLPNAIVAALFKRFRNLSSMLKIYRRWYQFLFALFLVGLASMLISTNSLAQLSNLEYELPTESKTDGYRLAFACGNLVRRIDGENASSKIHGFAVSRMVQDSVPEEDGQKLIMEAAAFSNYIAEFYNDNYSALNYTKHELCNEAKSLLSELPLIDLR